MLSSPIPLMKQFYSIDLKECSVVIVKFILILIFSYSAFSQIISYSTFLNALVKSPVIPYNFVKTVGNFVIIIELGLSVLLLFSGRSRLSLILSTFLMAFFTGYMLIIYYLSPYIPCSCGGVIEKLSWTDHIVFNIVVTSLAAFGVKFSK